MSRTGEISYVWDEKFVFYLLWLDKQVLHASEPVGTLTRIREKTINFAGVMLEWEILFFFTVFNSQFLCKTALYNNYKVQGFQQHYVKSAQT